MMGELFIGVDIGGTRTKLVLLEHPATVRDSGEIPSRLDGGQELVNAVAEAARGWLAQLPAPVALGVAVPGIVDRAAGRVLEAPNLDILDGLDICAALHSATGVEVSLDNDANAAGLAEARLGAAAGCRSAVCLTVGTGVGGAIIHEGQLWRGHSDMAGEIGHLAVGCDPTRYLEEDVGAGAVVRAYRQLSGQAAEGVDAATVARRAEVGDDAARQALAQCGAQLGIGLAILVDLLNPERIVVGGGVAGAGEWFLGPARSEGRRRAWPQSWSHCEVVVARLGAQAGAIGAALLAAERGRERAASDDDVGSR